MSDPILKTQSERQFVDDELITEIAVVKPWIVLCHDEKCWRVLISKDTTIEATLIRLRGVRLVSLPQGWRLKLIRFMSRFFPVRLPEERDYFEVEVEHDVRRPIVRAGGKFLYSQFKPCRSLPLSLEEYEILMNCRGRELYRWILDHRVATGAGDLSNPGYQRPAA